jgi:large subunit ribosomal protein L22
MESIAKANSVRHSAMRLRQVADIVRGRSVEESLAILGVMKNTRKGAKIVEGVLKSAIANLQNTDEGAAADLEQVKVKTITVDKGPLMKRIRARAQGRAFRIHKNLSHVTVVVGD